MNSIFTVGALTEKLRECLEIRFPFVWVRGEITNISRPASGHIYFALKDSQAQLNCAWFLKKQSTSSAGRKFDPLTGEVYEKTRPNPRDILRNGLEILCAGAISVYAGRGQYQLIVEFVEPSGTGLLAQAFEERKARLAQAGYFEQNHKRALPASPARVALITSPTGAAIHDFLEIAADRGLSASIRLFPTPVQGTEAAEKIAQTVEAINAQGWAQVIVIIRGGGSLEDLWAFNEEIVADAVFNSGIPVLAGIGHEIDFTLTDMTADARAATPSHAAQMLWPARREIWQKLDDLSIALGRVMDNRLRRAENSLDTFAARLDLLSPARRINLHGAKISELGQALHREAHRWWELKCQQWRVLDFGRRKGGHLAVLLKGVGEKLIWFGERVPALAGRMLESRQKKLDMLEQRAVEAMRAKFARNDATLKILETALVERNPLKPLDKGYALLYDVKGLVASAAGTQPGDEIRALLRDGQLALKVVKSEIDIGENHTSPST